jgi:hypothetical protein
MDSYTGRCWWCGQFINKSKMFCDPCYKIHKEQFYVGYNGVIYGVRKSEMIDHGKVHVSCP